MLTLNEKNGLKEILDSLQNDELFSLLETVTKRMFTTHNRSEAIETILALTEKPTDLLQRQKITKKIIFNYLIKKQCVLPEWGKIKLVQKCLDVWQSTECVKESDYLAEKNENTFTVPSPKNENTSIVPSSVTSAIGIQFANWFFKILNTLDGFGPEHFWPNCNLSAELYNPSEQKEISLAGANDAATFLANLIILDKYCFGANVNSESVLVEIEQHGLVKVLVSGVLYKHSNCVGLFNTAFGLVKNPDSVDNYKIQVIKVKMQVNCVTQESLPVSNHFPICQAS